MWVLRIALVLVATPAWGAGAIEFNYDGSITEATDAFVTLTPPGTPVQGTIGIDHAAVVDGRAGPADLDYIHVNVGGFCFSTSFDGSECPIQPSAYVPITRIDAVNLTFDGGAPTGGVLDTVGWGRSPYPVRLLIDADNQTVLLETQFLGMAAGIANLTTSAGDTDADGWLDNIDNCTAVANSNQADANSDDIGDLCDADIGGPGGIEDCQVDNSDLQAVRNAFFSTPDSANWYAPADIDADGHVDFRDLRIVKQQYLGPPGPSAVGCN